MDMRDTRAAGWQTFSGLVLALGGIFAVTYGLTAVYRSTFFVNDAIFVFSDLNTWGWITLGIGALAIASGLAVFGGRGWARWTGIAIAGLGALGQLMTAQAYPLWALMIMGVYLLAVYGLAVYGVRDTSSAARSRDERTASVIGDRPAAVRDAGEQERRAA